MAESIAQQQRNRDAHESNRIDNWLTDLTSRIECFNTSQIEEKHDTVLWGWDGNNKILTDMGRECVCVV